MQARFVGGIMDGRTEERESFGRFYIAPHSTPNGWAEHTYRMTGHQSDVLEFTLESTRDITAEMNAAIAKNRQQLLDMIFGDDERD